jgi:transcriptional regulator with XRE-family HTH domain
MSSGGRPVERPVHLAPQQRREAQAQTAAWRRASGLSQRDMAAKVGVGHSTYRMWESGNEVHAGPTRQQAQQLDRALRTLLGARYAEDRVFEIWGWPAERDMSYAGVAELLRAAGFVIPTPQTTSPSVVFWVHRLREPNLLHGVFALAAAATTRAGMSVCLLLDDAGLAAGARHDARGEFEARVRDWFAFASGDDSKLDISLYSAVLTSELLARRGWAAVVDYLNDKSGVLDFLLASKTVSPLQYSTDAEQSVLELVMQTESLRADRLLIPLRNWMVFEKEITRLSDNRSMNRPGSIVTLGGEDERILWELWHRGCAEELSARVHHIYLRPVPMPSYRVPWQESPLTARTSRPWLTTYLRNRTVRDGHADLAEWILKAAVGLPAALNPDFRAGLAPVLADADALLRAPADQLSSAAPAIAEAVVSWLSA